VFLLPCGFRVLKGDNAKYEWRPYARAVAIRAAQGGKSGDKRVHISRSVVKEMLASTSKQATQSCKLFMFLICTEATGKKE
jgi:hypothetical protein